MGIDFLIGMLGNAPPITAMGQAMKDFIASGGTLTLYAHPPTPVTAQQMDGLKSKTAADIAALFGLGGTRTP